ncbi:MAG TPA: protein kinase, partial [Polyangiaceae bacterium]
MSDLADYAVIEVVLEHDHFALYRARDAHNGEVLLKVTRDGASHDQLSALSSDFLTARRCDVPAIPRPIRIDTMATGGTFQVRRHVPGQPLSQWRDSRPVRPSQGESMQIVLLLLRALEPLHARGFVHCDINPRTLLYDSDRRGIYFVDCALTRGYGAVIQRKAWQLTPYLAPEQILDDAGKIDARADLYAVGVIGHELVTGELPSEEGLAPIVTASISGKFASVLAKLLNRDRERR